MPTNRTPKEKRGASKASNSTTPEESNITSNQNAATEDNTPQQMSQLLQKMSELMGELGNIRGEIEQTKSEIAEVKLENIHQKINQRPNLIMSSPTLPTSAQPNFVFPSPPSNRLLTTDLPDSQPQVQMGLSPTDSYPRPHNVNSIADTRRILCDLPRFDGKVDEWPMFISSYEETSKVYNYTNFENTLRLQKSLYGDAKESVECLLLHPDNVNNVIEQLKFRFGRPERLIKSQIEKVQQMPVISESRLYMLVAFSTKVKNLTAFLQAAGAGQYLGSPTLLDDLVNKLPMSKKLEWAQYASNIESHATIIDFSLWVEKVARLVIVVTDTDLYQKGQNFNGPKNVLSTQQATTSKINRCLVCKENHPLFHCLQFRKMSTEQKWNIVKNNHLCFSCLRAGHSISECKSKRTCDQNACKRKHHKLLHDSTSIQLNSSNAIQSQPLLNFHNSENNVLFRILPVILYGPKSQIKTYALLDEGSSVTIIDRALSYELGLKGQQQTLSLQWYSHHATSETANIVNVSISGVHRNAKKFELSNIYAVKNINLPTQTVDINLLGSQYSHLRSLPVSDYNEIRPQILIGVDNCHLGISQKFRKGFPHSPVAARTPLGWVVYGPTCNFIAQTTHRVCVVHSSTNNSDGQLNEIESLVGDYFNLENLGITKLNVNLESEDIKQAKATMEKTTRRIGDRFETGLLWKDNISNMPNSLPLSANRLNNIERKMSKNLNFKQQYQDKIEEYVRKGYARRLSSEEVNENYGKNWYLPHFGVTNVNKPGKFRLVFDAAAKVQGLSLNDMLLPGPDVNQSLLNILFKFRQAPIAVCADIKEMFHQVKIIEQDQHSQRFLFKNSKNGKNEVYVMTSMIFGATCSPALAQFVKNKNAKEHANICPEAAVAIIEKHYVDDYVDCFNSENDAIRIAAGVEAIHAKAGFQFGQFISNSKRVMDTLNMKKDGDCQPNVKWSINKNERILGMDWSTGYDVFQFCLKLHKVPAKILTHQVIPTKRQLLCIVMSIFDPFGFLSNITVYGKILLQSVWKSGIDWDEQLPVHLNEKWIKWHNELSHIEKLQIKRCYGTQFLDAADIQLHIFVDASEVAYAAVAFWRIVTRQRAIELSFVMSKTRCSSSKKLLSIPRLELQAAVLGIRLKNFILENHTVKVSQSIFWCDSKTVIAWLNSNHYQYKPFVAHRIAEILEHSTPKDWRWLPSKLNIADDATRDKFPTMYENNNRWINGPEFLYYNPHQWPQCKMSSKDNCHIEEMRPKYLNTLQKQKQFIVMPKIERFSKYERLRRTIAWIFRFVNNCHHNTERHKTGELTVDEIYSAEYYLCRVMQQESFYEEYIALSNKRDIDKNSSILNLMPYLDEKRVMRVQGRIDAAVFIPVSSRRPIILPKDHKITNLIVDYYHRRCHHQNHELIICQIREKFWVPNLRKLVKISSQRCQLCKNFAATTLQPIMGPLPEDRVTPYVYPFTYTGLDFFGPVFVTIGRSQVKRWVALFTCLTIRAVHIEMSTDLSTDACIICIRNFINRRGVPRRIRSDNGTNFVGVDNELKRIADFFDNNKIQAELGSYGVEWIFNCPSNPSSGGCWERLVQSIKRVLRKTLKEISPKPDTLYSLLIEAENIVNSRPLTHIPIRIEDEEPLTPNHFLLGRTNSTQTPSAVNPKLLCSRKQWRIAQQLKNSFWRRWIMEYLPDLTRRTKWCQNSKPIQLNDIVVIIDVNQPRSQWHKARVSKLYPGADQVVRIVELTTENGAVMKRPVSKLAVLDIMSKEIGESS